MGIRRSALRVLVVGGGLLCGCSITRRVEPIGGLAEPLICIEKNDAVWSQELLPVLRDEFERHGIRTTVVRAAYLPSSCRYRATYTADWNWDMALYLKSADIRVYDGDRLIGSVSYEASSWNPGKFGPTIDKLQPLLDEMLRDAVAGPACSAGSSSNLAAPDTPAARAGRAPRGKRPAPPAG